MDSVASNVENDDDWQGDMDVNPKEEVCHEGDKRKKQRGTNVNYQYSKSFETKEAALAFLNPDYMSRRDYVWGNVVLTEIREVRNIKCCHDGCQWVARLIYDFRGKSSILEIINQKNPGNNRAPGNQHDHTKSDNDNSNEDASDYEKEIRGLSKDQKNWVNKLYDNGQGFVSKMAILNKMKLQVQQQHTSGLDTLPPVPCGNKLQTYLRGLQILHLRIKYSENTRTLSQLKAENDILQERILKSKALKGLGSQKGISICYDLIHTFYNALFFYT
jgi:hypothetical protein